MGRVAELSSAIKSIEDVAIDALRPYDRNARTHSAEQIAQIAASITEFGFTNPVLIDETNGIVAGHGRVQAAQQLGLGVVPCLRLSGLTPAQIRAYVLADNKLALNAGWDFAMLRDELAELDTGDFDMSLTGFSVAELEQIATWTPDVMGDGHTDPDAIPPTPINAVSAMSDVWLLGGHRLMCGSSTEEKDVLALMCGQRAILFATDPPYVVDYKGGSHPTTKSNAGSATKDKDWSQVYREGGTEGDGEDFYNAFVAVAKAHAITETAAWYCWHASKRQAMLERVWVNNGAFAHQQIIWVKSRAVLTYSVYMWQHEPCLFGWVVGKKPTTKTAGHDVYPSTVWQIPNSEIESKDHPTSKPVRIFQLPMEMHTERGDLCFEPFSGSGSQIIAAERCGRLCYAMEISPQFVDVGVHRWQAFTGREATLDGDGRTFAEIAQERAQ